MRLYNYVTVSEFLQEQPDVKVVDVHPRMTLLNDSDFWEYRVSIFMSRVHCLITLLKHPNTLNYFSHDQFPYIHYI